MRDRGDLTSLSLLVAISATRLVCGLLIVKSFAFVLGPAQFGALSQIVGISGVLYSLAGGGVANGLILEIGRESDRSSRHQWLAAAFVVGAVSAVLLAFAAVGLGLFRPIGMFDEATPSSFFFGVALAQVFIGAGNTLLSFASGSGNLRAFAAANIGGTLIWAVSTVSATLAWGFYGALWAVVLTPMTTAFLIAILQKRALFEASLHFARPDRRRVIRLLKASGFTLLAVAALPVVHAILRADLAAQTDDWREVGLWQSAVRLSDAYMQVFGAIAINLLLPRMTRIDTGSARDREMLRLGGAMLLMFAVAGLTLYAFRETIVALAFSAEFLPAAVFVAPQLAADFAKVGAWILVYRFIASGRLWVQPAAEFLQAGALVAFYFILRPSVGAHAPVLGHLLSCIALLTVLAAAFLFSRRRDRADTAVDHIVFRQRERPQSHE